MRKTSHDGIDSTSITSGIENELKKAGTNLSKIKKSSIKRKVQNFSHESDDGIIEPLLQIEKEKSEIANRSAKYLLNKSKTDSYERGKRSSENFSEKNSISTPISSTSKIITSTEKDDEISTSNISGKTSIHNHMNTNIFSTYDGSKGIITTKSSVLVEIDGTKPIGYNPSSLIFTTAKIHTDSKTNFMEPVHVTPVPILSTIEGSVVKTVTNSAENTLNNVSSKPIDLTKNIYTKSEMNELPSLKSIPLVSTTVNTVSSNLEALSSKALFSTSESQTKNNKDTKLMDSVKDPIAVDSKDQKLSKLLNSTSINIKTKKDEICIETPTTMKTTNDSMTSMTLSSKVLPKSNETTLSQKPISVDNKSKILKSPQATADNRMENISKISPLSPDAINQASTSKISKFTEPVLSDKDNTNKSKVFSGGSKKLQRQKNASTEDTTDTINVTVLTKDKNESLEKTVLKIGDTKIVKDAISLPTATIAPVSVVSKTCVSTVSISQSTSKIKSPTNTKPGSISSSGSEDVSKTQNKLSNVPPSSKDMYKVTSASTAGTIDKKYGGSSSVMATFSKPDSSLSTSQSFKSDFVVKCDSPVVTTTLPSYIVSTSKTKIGSTLTCNTVTSTTKSQPQKPINEAVYTPTETVKLTTATQQSDRSQMGTSASNGTKHSIFSLQTKSNTDTFKKDGRA